MICLGIATLVDSQAAGQHHRLVLRMAAKLPALTCLGDLLFDPSLAVCWQCGLGNRYPTAIELCRRHREYYTPCTLPYALRQTAGMVGGLGGGSDRHGAARRHLFLPNADGAMQILVSVSQRQPAQHGIWKADTQLTRPPCFLPSCLHGRNEQRRGVTPGAGLQVAGGMSGPSSPAWTISSRISGPIGREHPPIGHGWTWPSDPSAVLDVRNKAPDLDAASQ
ncbi:hypothetical protein F4802DRAFT_267885 [Xylaria palmicola]|nr:hypothetical protein F4802DRAFT_267885 [Xylaria palmicola]